MVYAVLALLLSFLVACSATPPTPAPSPTATVVEPTAPAASPTATVVEPTAPAPAPRLTISPAPTLTAAPVVTRPPSSYGVSIGELAVTDVGEEANVNGHVVDVSSFSEGFKFALDDGTGQITLLLWHDVYDRIIKREILRVGALVQVTGEINIFEGELEIVPTSGTDVEVLTTGNQHALPRPTGLITTQDIGNWVLVEGEVVRADAFSSGERIYLDDGSGEIMLLLWQNVFERLPDGAIVPPAGSQLRAVGRVAEYQGKLEIVPALPFDVDIIHRETTPRPTRAIEVMPIGELDASLVGQKTTVSGQVVDAASFSMGFKFILEDGTGQVVLLTWHNIYDEIVDPEQLNVGAAISVTGEISEFEGELQIEPPSADNVQVTAPASPAPRPSAISSIATHLGQRTTIAGAVVAVEDTRSGTRIYVADDTGEALVYVWHNILERISNHQALLEIGSRVQITGVLQEYRGDLELVPALPYDVKVLE